MATLDITQYSTTVPLLKAMPVWLVDPLEQQRIASYAAFEAIYWNYPNTFRLVQRGDDADPIYVPAGRKIVEVINRYVAPGFGVATDPAFGSDTEQALARLMMDNLLSRERFLSKFGSNKRYGIIRGDWLWHIYADPMKPEGSRISLFELDPGSYFPIYNPENVDEQIGCHIVEHTKSDDGKTDLIRRLTYRKQTGTSGPSPITVSDTLFPVDDWGGPMMGDGVPVQVIRAEEVLPAPIDQLPVYHVQNFQEPGSPYGSSELRGLERLIGALNQGITDEELSLVLDGLGVYATNAGVPVDEATGEEKPWNIGPGRVVELPTGDNYDFKRVSGTTTVAPFQDHLKFLMDVIDQTTGTPGVAQGRVDVQTAQSGIALVLELAPILSRAGEKELIVTDVHKNMLYDLRRWFQAYEPNTGALENIRWKPTYGPKIPVNADKVLEDCLKLLAATPPVVSSRWVRRKLTTIGWHFEADEVLEAEILADTQKTADLAGARADQVLQDQLNAGGGVGGAADGTAVATAGAAGNGSAG